MRTHPRVNEFFKTYSQKKITNDIEFVVDDKIMFSTSKTHIFNNAHDVSNPFQCSLIIYTEINESESENEKQITYKKIFNTMPREESELTCEPVNYKFILTEILIGDKKILIKLSEDEQNYFVVGNVLNSEFIKFYLNTHYHEELKKNDISFTELTDYTVNILDQEVKPVVFDKKNVLILYKDTYEIKEL